MLYVFDTSSFIIMGHYFPLSFPTFWQNINDSVAKDELISVREVYNELNGQCSRAHLEAWVQDNKKIFKTPNADETAFVAAIFAVPHFQQL